MSAIAVKIQVPMLIKKENSKKKYAPSLLLFWDLIWRINLEAQHLHFLFAHPTVYKIQPGRAIAQPPPNAGLHCSAVTAVPQPSGTTHCCCSSEGKTALRGCLSIEENISDTEKDRGLSHPGSY